jgi:hypothetical protein
MFSMLTRGFSIVGPSVNLAPTKRITQLSNTSAEIKTMKKSIAIGFALSVLAAGSAFAAPEKAYQRAIVDASSATVLDSKVASKDAVKPFDSKSTSTVIVAENRKEFGSSYQRYE